MKKLKQYLTRIISSMIYHIKMLKYLPYKKDSPKDQDHTTVVTANKKAPPLECGDYMEIGGMWNLKHDIRLPKFYELPIKIELKGGTDMELKNFYNHIKMCLNAVTILQEDLIPDYQSITRHSKFEEYFIPDRDHPSYYWNYQT